MLPVCHCGFLIHWFQEGTSNEQDENEPVHRGFYSTAEDIQRYFRLKCGVDKKERCYRADLLPFDQSTAFDIVDHPMYLQLFQLFKMTAWVSMTLLLTGTSFTFTTE